MKNTLSSVVQCYKQFVCRCPKTFRCPELALGFRTLTVQRLDTHQHVWPTSGIDPTFGANFRVPSAASFRLQHNFVYSFPANDAQSFRQQLMAFFRLFPLQHVVLKRVRFFT